MIEVGTTFDFRDEMASFRNDVVHKGKIPPIAEVEKYAAEVFKAIKQVLAHLQTQCSDEIRQERLREANLQLAKLPKGIPTMSMGHVGINDVQLATFDDWRAKFREVRPFIRGDK